MANPRELIRVSTGTRWLLEDNGHIYREEPWSGACSYGYTYADLMENPKNKGEFIVGDTRTISEFMEDWAKNLLK